MKILDTIKKHGLAIRQIPNSVTSICSMFHFKPGNEVIERECKTISPKTLKTMKGPKENYVVRDRKVFLKQVKTVRIPEHAGWWMCQPSANTSASMEWSKKAHHLAPTLEESVALFLKNTAQG